MQAISKGKQMRFTGLKKALLTVVSLLTVTQINPVRAFAVDYATSEVPVHERITLHAIERVNGEFGITMSPAAIDFVISGNVNADKLNLRGHKIGADLNDYHVNNALNNNRQFIRSFDLVRRSVNRAIVLANENPRFLNPAHGPERMGVILENSCGIARVCDAISWFIDQIRENEYRDKDPHWGVGKNAIELVASVDKLLRDATLRNDGQAITELRDIKNELHAYEARQLIGHALHTLQDTFAHSNFVELMHEKKGPPCRGNFANRSEVCSRRAIPEYPATQRYNDPIFGEFYRLLGTDFSFQLSTFRRVLGDKASRFQTGYVTGLGGCPEGRDEMPANAQYCHYNGNTRPALNKDKPGSESASNENFSAARRAALIASEILWEYVLHGAKLAPRRLANLAAISLVEGTPKVPIAATKVNSELAKTTTIVNAPGVTTLLAPRISVRLNKPSRLRTSLRYRIWGAQGARDGVTCTLGVDIIRRSGEIALPPGQQKASIRIPICPDSEIEQTQNFRLQLSGDGIETVQEVFQIQEDDRLLLPKTLVPEGIHQIKKQREAPRQDPIKRGVLPLPRGRGSVDKSKEDY